MVCLFLFVPACSSQIGDQCQHRDDCPTGAVCDRSVEDGFCTVRDCRIGECPSESVCVEYTRHEAFCMRSCQTDDDCRRDHRCIDDADVGKSYCFIDD